MLSEGSRLAQETLSPGPRSSLLSSPESTSSNTAKRSSSSTRPGQNELRGVTGFADQDGPHTSVSVASPSTPKISHLPTPPDTPEGLFTSPRPEGRTLSPDLATLREESGIHSPSPLSQGQIVQDTESSSSPSIPEATATSEPAGSNLQPEDHVVQHTESCWSLSLLEARTSEPVTPSPVEPGSSSASFPGPDSHIAWRIVRPLLNILAPLLSSRARAREQRVRSVIRLIKAARDGKLSSTQPSTSRTLHPSEYQEVLDRVEEHSALRGFFRDRLRYEYSSVHHRFTIYMPGGFHETFLRKAEFRINNLLDEHKSSGDRIVARIAQGIDGQGARTLRGLKIPDDEMGPDASFKLLGCTYPGLVMEVAWSSGDMSKLKEKAKYYFENTDAQIRTVVGIDLSNIYKKQNAAEKRWLADFNKWQKGKSDTPPEPLIFLAPGAAVECARFSVWRAKYNTQTGKTSLTNKTVQDQVFRDADQKPNPDVSLKLTLEDFVCKEKVDRLCIEEEGRVRKVEYPPLEIPSQLLCEWFDRTVEQYREEWELDQQVKRTKKQRKEEAAVAAQRKRAAELEEEARRSTGSTESKGRYRLGNLVRSLRLRKLRGDK